MNTAVKGILVALGLAVGAFILFNSVMGSKKKDCYGGQGKPAMDACTFLIKWQPGAAKAEALFKRSRLYSVQELYDREFSDLEAILPFVKSPQLSASRRAEIYAGLSIAAGRKSDHAAAMKYSELAVREGTADPQVYLSLAGAYIEAGRFRESATLLESAAGIERKHPYYNALAAAYGGLGEYPKAYETLKAGLNVNAPRPVLAETAKHMGLVCFELKRYKEAELYLNYAMKSGADCPECPLLLTTIRESLGVY
jgi:tetratricopeptide (TPR) repeat protein